MNILNYLYGLTPVQLAALISLLTPYVVAFLVKEHVDNRVRRIVNVALSALVALLAGYVSFSHFDWTAFGNAWITAIITSTVSYVGVVKTSANRLSIATSNIGLGGTPPADDTDVTPDDLAEEDVVDPTSLPDIGGQSN